MWLKRNYVKCLELSLVRQQIHGLEKKWTEVLPVFLLLEHIAISISFNVGRYCFVNYSQGTSNLRLNVGTVSWFQHNAWVISRLKFSLNLIQIKGCAVPIQSRISSVGAVMGNKKITRYALSHGSKVRASITEFRSASPAPSSTSAVGGSQESHNTDLTQLSECDQIKFWGMGEATQDELCDVLGIGHWLNGCINRRRQHKVFGGRLLDDFYCLGTHRIVHCVYQLQPCSYRLTFLHLAMFLWFYLKPFPAFLKCHTILKDSL